MKKLKKAISLMLIVFMTFGVIFLFLGNADKAYAISGVSWKLKSGISVPVNKTWELNTPEDVSEIEVEFSHMEYVLSEAHEYDPESDVTRTYTDGDVTFTCTPYNSYGYVQQYSVTMTSFKLTSEDGWTRTLHFPDLTADIGEGYYCLYPAYCYEYINGEEQDSILSGNPESDYLVTFESTADTGAYDEETIYDTFSINVSNTPNYTDAYYVCIAKQWPSDVPKEDVTIEIYQDGEYFGKLNLNSSSESVSGSDFALNYYYYYIDTDTLGIMDDAELWYKNLLLPKNDGQGHEYEYTFKESGDTYRNEVKTQQDSDYLFAVVTNQERLPDLIDITVTKKWEGTEGTKAVVHLFAGDQEVDSAELTSGNWTYVFTGLPETDENGNTIEYTVTEDAVSGYTTEITGSAQDGFLITNTEEATPTPKDDTDESNKTSEKAESPQTGDESYTGAYALIMLGSMIAAAVIMRKRTASR